MATGLTSPGTSVAAPPAASVSPALADQQEPAAPFTLAVIPDTQGYTVDDTRAATMHAQTQWVVDHSEELGIEFTVQLGDLVETWNDTTMWRRVSSAFETLDQNAIPYSVLPGNHDLNASTGLAQYYDQFFPPSRFSGAAWNTAEKRYGGYLGSNTFGPDPANRRNMNNFSLFSAGGLDWVVINLEFESPTDSLQWAQRVLDAHPDRRAILVTHGFVDTAGARNNLKVRTGAEISSSNRVWNDLVHKNCNVALVINGHYHDGDLGEARRSDPNACGTPVHQLLSDYQSRPNGGDGWLRYYTFDPAHDRIDAFTYSPTRREFETDASSRFSLDYDMTPDPDTRTEVVVPGGTPWRYRNATGAWPKDWDQPAYDDSSWPSARGPLGFNAGMLATSIDLGPPTSNRARGMLFRRGFALDRPEEVTSLRLVTKADDGLVVRVNGQEVGRANMPAGAVDATTYASAAPRSMAATTATYEVPLALLRPSGNVIAASTHLNYLGTTDAHFDLVAVARRGSVAAPPTTPQPQPQPQPVTLVDGSGTWRWRFSPDPWPASWTTPALDDSSWRTGAAPLGFGTPVATNIDVPAPTSNRPRSALFRRTFVIDDPALYSGLRLRSRADDGVAIWVNGTEVNRTRLPAGALSNASYATAAVSTAAAVGTPVDVSVPASLLRAGTNVVTAATVLNYRGTPNASFTAELTALRTPPPTAPLVPARPQVSVRATTAGSVTLDWAPGDAVPVTGWVLQRTGAPALELPGGARSHADSGLAAQTTYSYTLTARNGAASSPPVMVTATTPRPATATPVTLVPTGSPWRHLYSSTWPAGWTATGFDDTAWGRGTAPLGFGSPTIATNVDVPAPTSNRPRSVLLRHSFEVTDPEKLSGSRISTRADDGVVVFVNGVELGRSNVAAGAVGPTTYATAAPSTSRALGAEVRWEVPPTMLRVGTNTIAALVLVNYRATPDLSFDLSLTAQSVN